MPTERDFLQFNLKFLRGSGLAHDSSKLRKFFSLCVLLPMALIVDFCVIYNFKYVGNNMRKLSGLMESTSSFGQLLVRKFLLVFYQKIFKKILQQRKELWRYDMFGEEFEQFLNNKMILTINVIKTMWVLCGILATLVCVPTFLDDEKRLPLESWTPKNNILYVALFILQYVSLLEIMYLLGVFDAFYIFICVEIRNQLLLLRKKLQTIRLDIKTKKKCLRDLIKCTQHHNILLELHHDLNKIYSTYFLFQYGLTVLACSVEFYVLFYMEGSVEYILKCISYVAALLFQVGMFFMPASDVETEGENLVVEIYNVNWEFSNDRKIREHLLFMMMKAQRPLAMMGGGMVYINRSEYLVIFKMAFSIATLLGGMNN